MVTAMTLHRIEPGRRMSQAVVHGGTVYLAGIVAGDPTPSVTAQTRQILAEIDRLLALAGTSPPNGGRVAAPKAMRR